MQLPRDTLGRIVCVVAGLLFGVGASWLFGLGLMQVGRRLDRLWVFEFLAMFAAFGWGIFVWGIAMPAWITRVVNHATTYIIVAIFVLFFPIAFEFVLLGFQGKLP
jgi:hypothetical protein